MPLRHASSPTAHDVFEILVREHADMLMAYLRSLVRDPAAVDDLFQESMLTAWRRLDDFDRERPFGPWLRGIATRLVLQHRRRAAGAAFNCDPAVLAALEQSFDDLARQPGDSFRDRAERLFDCLRRLPATLRETVELAYARDLLLHQVATTLGCTEEAVKKRVQRSRQLLADCIRTSEVHVP